MRKTKSTPSRKMEADAFSRMGVAHLICQDYVSAGHTAGKAFAFLSDGCSGADEDGRVPDVASGFPYTDWGARILVSLARKRLGILSEGCFPEASLALEMATLCRTLGLPEAALDATLFGVVETAAGNLVVHRTADGVYATVDVEGRIFYESISYARGMPRYLNYLLSSQRHDQLLAPRGKPDDLLAGTREVTSNTWFPDTGWGPQLLRLETFGSHSVFHRTNYLLTSESEDGSLSAAIKVCAVLSDGVESFVDRDGSPVPLETVLPVLLSFKNHHGRFVVRRCKKFLDRTCAERGWKHQDDFSMAAVALTGAESRGQRAEVSEAGAEGSGAERGETP